MVIMSSTREFNLNASDIRTLTRNSNITRITNYLIEKINAAISQYQTSVDIDANNIKGIVEYWSDIEAKIKEAGFEYSVRNEISKIEKTTTISTASATEASNTSYEYLKNIIFEAIGRGENSLSIMEFDIPNFEGALYSSFIGPIMNKLKSKIFVEYITDSISTYNPKTQTSGQYVQYTFDLSISNLVANSIRYLENLAYQAMNNNKTAVEVDDINTIPNFNNDNIRNKTISYMTNQGYSIQTPVFKGYDSRGNYTKKRTLIMNFSRTYILTIRWKPPSGSDPSTYSYADTMYMNMQEKVDSLFGNFLEETKNSIYSTASNGNNKYSTTISGEIASNTSWVNDVVNKIRAKGFSVEVRNSSTSKIIVISW